MDDTLKGSFGYNAANKFSEMAVLDRSFQYSDSIINNKVAFEVSSSDEQPTYIKFSYDYSTQAIAKSRSYQILTLSRSFILPQAGKLNIQIYKDTIVFKGDGADLLTCQYRIYSVIKNKEKESGEILMKKSLAAKQMDQAAYYQSLQEFRDFKLHTYRTQMDILAMYGGKIESELIERIRQDMWGHIMNNLLSATIFEIDLGRASKKSPLGKTLLRFYEDYFWLGNEKSINLKEEKILSYSYAYSLYRKNLYDLLIPLYANGTKIKVNFDQIFQKLSFVYSDHIPDFVTGALFYNFSGRNEIPSWAFEQNLEKVKDEGVKELLLRVKQAKSVGLPAFNFNLQDTSQKTVTLKDLRGKVLVLDFWYTGCYGCASLSREMKPIFEHYRNNPKVEFVSISIDDDLETWKNSVRKGFFTHTEALNLYTKGEGIEEPTIKHYNIFNYPTVIIIDKEGKVAKINPPKPSPDNPGAEMRFISLIDELIEE